MSKLQPIPQLDNERVLIVDDLADARETLGAFFDLLGAEVKLAASGMQGLEQWEAWQPTVILSDIGMPHLNGYQFIRAVRTVEREQRRPHTPAVAISAYMKEIDRLMAKTAGFDRYVAKPADPVELAIIVQELVQERFGHSLDASDSDRFRPSPTLD